MGSNAVELHVGKPRHLNYAPALRDDYRLLEVDEATLKEVLELGCAAAAPRSPVYIATNQQQQQQQQQLAPRGAWLTPCPMRRVVMKGQGHEELVMCTLNKTYALKHVETSNALLLLPPREVRRRRCRRLRLGSGLCPPCHPACAALACPGAEDRPCCAPAG